MIAVKLCLLAIQVVCLIAAVVFLAKGYALPAMALSLAAVFVVPIQLLVKA